MGGVGETTVKFVSVPFWWCSHPFLILATLPISAIWTTDALQLVCHLLYILWGELKGLHKLVLKKVICDY